MMRNVIILGSGPAGLTAAIYTGRANLKPLVIAGNEPGGQLITTTDVENFPGFPEGIQGPELMNKMRKQAERFGAEFLDQNFSSLDISSVPIAVVVGKQRIETQTIILATGASSKWLGLESEQRFRGHGVSSCATCDGAFFKNKKVLIVGGGDAAMEEANFLTRYASSVIVIHRRDVFRASKIMLDRARANSKISFLTNKVVVEILGETKVTGALVKDVKTGAEETMDAQGIFIAIGHSPNTNEVKDILDMDMKGYVIPVNGSKTNREGIFVAGDVHDHQYRQAITAAGSGCMAAMDVIRALDGHKKNPQDLKNP